MSFKVLAMMDQTYSALYLPVAALKNQVPSICFEKSASEL